MGFLKIEQVSSIHKEKGTLTVSNYRPLSLLSVFSNIFKKFTYQIIYSFPYKYELINTNQFALRSKYSSKQKLKNLTETIRKSLDNDEIISGVLIDLKKALDTVSHEILLKKLNHYGLRSKENDWFYSFLTNQKQYVSVEGFFSQTKFVRCSVPQDSSFGPLPFLIYIDDFNNALEECIVHHFADDTNLLFGKKCPYEMSCVMNDELKLLIDWLRTNKLSLNESKMVS